jgi:hypothetical protein
MHFLIQVSNHPGAGSRLPTTEASNSWQTVYDGPIATATEAREAVNKLSDFYRNARCFKGLNIGKLHYAVLR